MDTESLKIMLINKIIGNIYWNSKENWWNYTIDYLELEWYELNKEVLRKQTIAKREIGLHFESGSRILSDGDVLAVIETTLIVVKVKPNECIALIAGSNYELAKMCYEMGNCRVPLFIDENNNRRLLLPKDKSLQMMLEKMGFEPITIRARLIKPLSATLSKSYET